jgi:hypothetical protein
MAASPLFDLYDPYGLLQDQARMGLLPSDDPDEELRRRATVADLMPQEQQSSMLGKLAEMGTSGLAGLGWILDTPGAMVRGLLSEGPGKAISALWDTSDERVTGRELARQYGMASNKDNWWNFGGGLAAEVLLDPLTYMSFGANQLLGAPAKTLAGRAAQKAGMMGHMDDYARAAGVGPRVAARNATADELLKLMPADAAAAARQRFVADMGEEALTAPLARMNRIGLPGMTQGATDLFGQTIGDATAKWADEAGDSLMRNDITGPVLRRLNAAVGDADVLGMTDYDRQLEAKELSSLRRRRAAADRRTLADLQMRAENVLRGEGRSLGELDLSRGLRSALELGPESIADDTAELLSRPGVQDVTDFWDAYRDATPDRRRGLGLPIEEWQSRAGTQFVPRQQVGFDVPQRPEWPAGVVPPERIKQQYSRGNRRVNFSENLGRRRRDYTDAVGGTDTLDRLSLDPEVQKALREAANPDARLLLEDWAARNLDIGDGGLYGWVDELDTRAQDQIDSLTAEMNRLTERAGGPTRRTQQLQEQIDAMRADLPGEPQYLHKAPPLAADHPLAAQQAELSKQLAAAQRGGELHRVGELKRQLDSVVAQIPDAERDAWKDSLYTKLADFTRAMDPQHAKTGVPIFGQNTFQEISRYVQSGGRLETDADFMLNLLKKQAADVGVDDVIGNVNYTPAETLTRLGLTGEDALKVLEKRVGRPLANVSFPKKFVDDWSRVVERGQVAPELNPILEAGDNFLKTFKTLALAWPSRYSRDAYSGAFAAAMRNSFNPVDWYVGTQLRKGNYDPLVKPMLGGLIPPRLAGAPEYAELLKANPDEAVRRFLLDAGEQGMGSGTVSNELADAAANAQMRELYPGAANPQWSEVGRRFYNPDRTWREALRDYNPLATRGASGNRNPILELADRAGETTDAGNRYGTYLNQIRQGAAPEEAARVANLTQVNYSPDAFTNFERDVLKRIFPFYSYTRGIMPLIGSELVNNPAGLMGKTTRAIARGSAPSEDNFTPEYLRQSASIPLPEGLPLLGLDPGSNLKRYLTNIDLPFESVINLVTPGVGNSTLETAGGTLRKTALNLLGQTNPLIKGPLELFTNRQFYSGRQLSDLYSVLEQTLGAPGRLAEQVLVNAPGGSRLVGTYRQLTDDRLSPQEKYSKLLWNAMTGLKFQDVDQERTRRLAARDTLNQLLETTPGVRTYENITVPEDVLRGMPKEQRDMYLLYKIIQSTAAKQAREKKKQQAALDPLQMLGVLNQF